MRCETTYLLPAWLPELVDVILGDDVRFGDVPGALGVLARAQEIE